MILLILTIASERFYEDLSETIPTYSKALILEPSKRILMLEKLHFVFPEMPGLGVQSGRN